MKVNIQYGVYIHITNTDTGSCVNTLHLMSILITIKQNTSMKTIILSCPLITTNYTSQTKIDTWNIIMFFHTLAI